MQFASNNIIAGSYPWSRIRQIWPAEFGFASAAEWKSESASAERPGYGREADQGLLDGSAAGDIKPTSRPCFRFAGGLATSRGDGKNISRPLIRRRCDHMCREMSARGVGFNCFVGDQNPCLGC